MIFFFISYCYFISLGINSSSYFYLIVINSAICITNIVNIERKPYSLKMFVNIFFYFFFILANAIQYVNNSNYLTFSLILNEQNYIIFQFVFLIILILFNITYEITPISRHRNNKSYTIPSARRLLLMSFIVTLFILFYYKFNVLELFARGLADSMMEENGIEKEDFSSTSFLVFNYIIRPIPWACLILSLLYHLKRRLVMILLLFTFITVCPTGVARNAAAMYWLPVFIITCQKWIKGHNIIFVVFIGLLVVFPFLDNFRYFNGAVNFDFGLDYLDSMNFDASQIFMAVLKTDTISWGKQLLGVFLFFVPRSIWPDKPVGSGHFLVIQNNGSFTNVSMPFFAEGYINFGFLGIILFTIIFGVFAKKLDSSFWSSFKISTWKHGIYYLVLAASLFIMRGDLLSSFSYTLGLACTYTMAAKLAGVKDRACLHRRMTFLRKRLVDV